MPSYAVQPGDLAQAPLPSLSPFSLSIPHTIYPPPRRGGGSLGPPSGPALLSLYYCASIPQSPRGCYGDNSHFLTWRYEAVLAFGDDPALVLAHRAADGQ